jgi:DNA repair protein RecO (recombination protein O)
MQIKTRGIVFRVTKYGETSVIADVYTEARGLRKYIVNGVRSAKAGVKASLLQVMSLVDMVAYEREDKSLHHIREIRAAHVYSALPFELRRSAVGLFMVEVAQKTIREPEENKLLFNFLFETFCYLDATDQPVNNIHLYFLLGLSTFLGFLPGGQFSAEKPFFDLKEGVFVADAPTVHLFYLDEKSSELLHDLLHADLASCHQISMTREQRRVLVHRLLEYYALHIEHFPAIHTHKVYQDVLDA